MAEEKKVKKTKKITSKKVEKNPQISKEISEPKSVSSSPFNMLLGFTSQERMITIMTIALIGASFFLGYFYGQLTALKSGGGSRVAAPSNPSAAGAPAAVASMTITEVAEDAGLDMNDFQQCMDDQKYATAVADDLSLAQSVGANGTPSFFINGKILVGAQPYSAFEEAIDAALAGNQVAGDTALLDDAQWQELLQNPAYSAGNNNATVTLVEFTDYQCPFCARHYNDTHGLIQENYVDTGKINYVVRDLPLPFHSKADEAAQAARCAGDQGKYKEMHQALFDNQTAWGV